MWPLRVRRRTLSVTENLHLRDAVQGWTRIAKAVNADSRVANRVIYDVLNEPDAFGLKFEPKGGKPGMRDLYLKSFDAIYAVNPGGLAYVAWQACSLCRVVDGHL